MEILGNQSLIQNAIKNETKYKTSDIVRVIIGWCSSLGENDQKKYDNDMSAANPMFPWMRMSLSLYG
jgi:hypothetical protein